MTKTLDVYLHHDLVGHLVQNAGGQMVFTYDPGWLENPQRIPLSHSLPLRPEPFSQKECVGYVNGILPEEGVRETIAKNLGISPNNDFSMLEKIGGECAGAVTFMPAGTPLPTREDTYRDLSPKELAEMIRTLPRRPMLAGEDGIRLSLAGAQDKIVVKVSGDTISVPLNGAASTHILKPDNPRFPGLVFNELLCLQLARAVNLSVASAETRQLEGMDFLLVERYDRRLVHPPQGVEHYVRLHQEDFCQALGIPSRNKYQSEGGPSLKDCFGLVRAATDVPVTYLNRLLDAVIFNYLIGNNDAHGKNFSLIYLDGAAILAPLYDLVSTVFYPELSKKMAMKIGGEYNADNITPRNFEKMAEETGLAKPIVRKRVAELAEAVLQGLKVFRREPFQEIAALIEKRCKETLAAFAEHEPKKSVK